MNNVEELERALEYPWEKWTVFLHPAQRQLVEGDGPVRISGSAGTGKTIVALHRAVFLARTNPDARVLLTTFSDTLANALRTKLKSLISNEPRIGERLEVHAINAIGRRLFELNFGRSQIASREVIQQLLTEAAREVDGQKFSIHFLMTEWEQVVDAWQLETWDFRFSSLSLNALLELTKSNHTEKQSALVTLVNPTHHTWIRLSFDQFRNNICIQKRYFTIPPRGISLHFFLRQVLHHIRATP